MKKITYAALLLLAAITYLPSCIKTRTDRTIDVSMSATIDSLSFNSNYVIPSITKNQVADTATILSISSVDSVTGDKIIVSVNRFKGTTGNYSIADSMASAIYIKNNVAMIATSGYVAIKDVGVNIIVGDFSFNVPGHTIKLGNYTVGKPWAY